jgi:sec-independent protein translocase protein TatC
LQYRTLVGGRQYAIVGIVVLVAIITPSGAPFTLMILSVPMWLFYEVSIGFGWMRERRARKKAAAAA